LVGVAVVIGVLRLAERAVVALESIAADLKRLTEIADELTVQVKGGRAFDVSIRGVVLTERNQ
jgi:hypothetical protein